MKLRGVWTAAGGLYGGGRPKNGAARRVPQNDKAALDAALPAGFNYVDYVYCNRDLADKFPGEAAAAEHYVRHGIPEGRRLSSDAVDVAFVHKLYDVRIPFGLDLKEVHRVLAARGIARVYPTQEHALRFNGLINDDFLRLFDHDFYRLGNHLDDVLGPRPTRAKALTHFCEIGVNLGLPFSSTTVFDPGFYAAALAEDAALANPVGEPIWLSTRAVPTLFSRDVLSDRSGTVRDHARMLRHWLNVGLPGGRAPNLRSWLEQTCHVRVGDLGGLDLDVYRALNRDLAALRSDWAVARHFVTFGLVEGRPGTEPTPANAEAVLTRAEDLSGAGQIDNAELLFDRLLLAFPDYSAAYHVAGDNAYKRRSYRAAAALYRAAIASGVGSIWSHLNLSHALGELGDRRGSYQALALAASTFREDFQLKARFAEGRRGFFDASDMVIGQRAAVGRIAEAQADLTRLCEDVTPPRRASADHRPIRRIALVANLDLYQCRVYRVDQKIEQLERADYAVRLFDHRGGMRAFIDEADAFDAVIFYRVASNLDVIDAITCATERGLVVFYEIDDLVFDAAHYPESFESYGGLISRAEYAGLALGTPVFAHAMSLCHYGIASTPALAREMARFIGSGQVFVHRNGFGSGHERWAARHGTVERPDRARSDVVTIFYGSGTKAHKQDFRDLVEPAFRRLVKRHGARIRIVIVGYNPLADMSGELAGHVTVYPPIWNMDAFWSILETADINVAVVKPSVVTGAKSEIKWLEAGMLAIPSVVSRTATYEEVVEHGATGFLCASADAFYTHLDALVSDRDLRIRVGEAARAVALERYSVAALAENIDGILRSVSPVAAPRPKIVIVNVFYAPQAFGGATRVVHDNVRDLRARFGHLYDIEVFTSIEGSPDPFRVVRYVEDGVRVTGVTTPDDGEINRVFLSERMGEIFRTYLASVEPDLIHFHCVQRLSASILLEALRRDIPYVITVHDGWWISERQFLADEDGEIELYDFDDPLRIAQEQGGRAMERQTALKPALFGAKAVLAVSDPFAEFYRRAHVPNVASVPNGVSKLPSGIRTPSPDGRVRLGHIGGIERHKGLYLVKQALLQDSFRHLSLTVVDYAKRRGSVSEETWGTTPVRVIAPLPQGSVADLYKDLDVHLAPSVWPESFGLVTRESAAFGCWVVASDNGSIAEPVIEGGNGHIVRSGDLGDLVRVLTQIDQDPARYLGPTQATPVIRTSVEQAADLAAIYDRILAERASGLSEDARLEVGLPVCRTGVA